MLENRALLERDPLNGTAAEDACAVQDGSASVSMHHVTVVALESSAASQLGWVLDVLAEANRISEATRFTWDVLALADYGNGLRGEHADSGLYFQSRSAVFIADDRLDIRLNDIERERLRKVVRQQTLALACGPAVQLFAECSLLQRRPAAACRATSGWLREKFPDTCFRTEPLIWSGRIGTSAGGVAIAAAMLELIARLGLATLAREIRGRLLLPALNAEQPGLSPRVRFGARSSKISRAISFMQENLEAALPADVLASHVGSSVRQLERLFKTQVGTTPARFLKRLRLEQAQSLLLNTDLSIVEIVCASGFECPTHFSKSFKHAFSASPTNWRKEKRRPQLVKAEAKAEARERGSSRKSISSAAATGAGIVSC